MIKSKGQEMLRGGMSRGYTGFQAPPPNCTPLLGSHYANFVVWKLHAAGLMVTTLPPLPSKTL